jgi:outer membrane receptor protein involved in Fe transport
MDEFSGLLFARFLGPFIECSPDGGVVAGSATGPGFCYTKSGPSPTTTYPVHKVPSALTWDLLLAYRLKSPVGQTRLSVGVRNIFDSSPPRVYDSFLTYADTAYDFVGRYVYGRIEHTF